MAIGTLAFSTQQFRTAELSTLVTMPATVGKGDFLFIWGRVNNSPLVTTPAGWTTVVSFSRTGNTLAPTIFFAYKTGMAVGNEGGTTVSVTHSNNISTWIAGTVSGVDPNNPIDAAPLTGDTGVADNSSSLTGYTTTIANCLVMFMASQTGTAATSTPPGGYTEDADNTAASNVGTLAHKANAAAGSQGTVANTWSLSIAHIEAMFALRPAQGLSPVSLTPGQTWQRRFKHPQTVQPVAGGAAQTLSAAVVVSATATVSAAATQTLSDAAATISAAATVSAAAVVEKPAAATITATATVTAGATVINAATANISATATVTAAATLTQLAAVTVAPTASLTATATQVFQVASTVVATATVAAAAVVNKIAAIAINPSASVTATATQKMFATFVMNAVAFLTATATIPGTVSAVPQPLQAALNRVAGTVGLEAQGAANVWAGTVGLDLIGALNAKAGTTGYEFLLVLNTLAGTTGLDEEGCARNLH